MGGSAPSNVKTNVTNDLPAWARPYADRFMSESFGQILPGSRMVDLGVGRDGKNKYALEGGEIGGYGGPDRQVLGFNDIENAIRQYEQAYLGVNHPLMGQTNMMAQRILNGKYLDPASNPWLERTYDDAAGAVTKNYRDAVAPSRAAQFAMAGALGGSAQANSTLVDEYGLGKNLDELATSIYGGNYQQERDRQMATMNFMPSLIGFNENLNLNRIDRYKALGADQRQLAQAQADAGYENEMTRYRYPMEMLQQLGAMMGLGTGNASSQTSIAPNPNQGNAAATYGGLGIAGAGVLAQLYGATP